MITKFQKKVYPVRKNKRNTDRREISEFSNGVYRVVKYWLPVIIWAGIIFILSSIPNLESGLKQDFILRKIAHILEYAILTFLLIRAMRIEKLNIKKAIIFSVIIAFFYALTDEYHQTFVFGREGSFKDIGIDSLGIILTLILCYTKYRKGRVIVINE